MRQAVSEKHNVGTANLAAILAVAWLTCRNSRPFVTIGPRAGKGVVSLSPDLE
jgi:hypothetical protein